MYYRPKQVILNQKPLVPREPWWWETLFRKCKKFIIALYELFLVFLAYFHAQFIQQEKYKGEYASQYQYSTNELRAHCLMREAAKLLAVMAKPEAVQFRQQTLALYQEEKKKLETQANSRISRWLAYLFPKSLFAHHHRFAKTNWQFYDSLCTELENTPAKRAAMRLEKLRLEIENINCQFRTFHAKTTPLSSLEVAQHKLLESEILRISNDYCSLKSELETDDDCTLEESQRFSFRKEREYSSNIDDWYYDEQQRSNHLSEMNFLLMDRRDLQAHDGKIWKQKAQSLVHPDLNKWLTRKMAFAYSGTEIEGDIHLIMWFHPLKFCFMYTTNLERTIDARILQAAAAKYVLLYRCVDFFVDDIFFGFMKQTIHPEMRKYFLQEERQFKKKKKVRQPDGEFVWMLEDDWMKEFLQRQGFEEPEKYKVIDYRPESEVHDANSNYATYSEEGTLISLSAPPSTQDEIDAEYMEHCAIIERPPDNKFAIAKVGQKVKQLEKLIPEYNNQIRLRFERAVQSEDIPQELTIQRDNSHIPYFTNKEFEIHTIMYHGPGSQHPVNRTGKMIMETDPILNGLNNSQKMIEFAYENANSRNILQIGLERLESAKKEAKMLCLTTGREEDDYGRYVRQLRIDENSKTNSEAVEKLRITYEINQLLQQGMDTTDLLLQLEDLPADVPLKQLLEYQPDGQSVCIDRSVKLLLENGNRDSNYLQVHGYYNMQSEEKKEALENKLIEMRKECVTKHLNEVANTAYFSTQIQQNVKMMQTGKYIDIKKEATRFARHTESESFQHAKNNALSYLEYVEKAKEIDNERRSLFLENAKREDSESGSESGNEDSEDSEIESGSESGNEDSEDESESESGSESGNEHL